SCDGGGSQTSLKLSVAFEPAWQLSALEVTAAAHSGRAAPSSTVKVLLSDSDAGKPLEIQVAGYRGTQRWAVGRTTVTPRVGEEVARSVTLLRTACDELCSPGSSTCVGDGVARCELQADGCLNWGSTI